MMALQSEILLALTNIRCGFLNFLANAVSFAGESAITVAVALFLLFCVDKRKGQAVTLSIAGADLAMNTLKALLAIPRPFMVDPRLTCLREDTATGYSFPSIHTGNASVMLGSVASLWKERKWLKASCLAFVIAVGLSRIYLCCHWPMDVVAAWILGLSAAFLVTGRLVKALDKKPFKGFALYAGPVLVIAGIAMALGTDFMGFDARRFSDLSANCGLLGATMLSICWEERLAGFKIPSSWAKRLALFACAMVGALVLNKIPDFVSTAFPITLDCAMKALVAVWGFFIMPLVGKKTGLAD